MPFTETASKHESTLRRMMREYAAEFENTHVRTRAQIPVSSMVEYDPADLTMLSEEIGAIDFEATEGYAALAARRESMIDEADRRARDAARGQENLQNMYNAVNFWDSGPDTEFDFNDAVTRHFQTQYQSLFEEYQKSLEGEPVPDEPNWFQKLFNQAPALSASQAAMNGFLGPLGSRVVPWMMEQMQHVPVTEILLPGSSHSLMQLGQLVSPTEGPKSTTELLNREQLESRYQQNLAAMADVGFDQMDPQLQQFLVDAAGGDVLKAQGFMLEGFLGDPNNIGAVQQMRQAAFDVENEVLLQSLKENQFRIDYSVLDLLDDFGRFTLSAAVGANLLLADQDFVDMAKSGQFRNILNEIAEYDAKPSAVWGFNDTFLGLGFDLGMSVIFDPSTWLFAPAKGASALRQFSTAENALGLARSATGRQVLSDTISLTQRGGKGWLSATSWMPINQRMRFTRAVRDGNLEDAGKLYEEAMLLGGRPGRAGRLAWTHYMGNITRATLDHADDPITASHRFTDAVSNRTSVELYGASYVDDVLETFAVLHGDDLASFDTFADEFMKVSTEITLGHDDKLAALRTEMGTLSEEIGTLRQLAEGNVRPLVEGFTIGGQTYDDLDSALGFIASSTVTEGDDLGRLAGQSRVLQSLKGQIDNQAGDQLPEMFRIGKATDEELAAMDNVGLEIQNVTPRPAPGKPSGVGPVVASGATQRVPFYQDEQLVGFLTLKYDAPIEAGGANLVDWEVRVAQGRSGIGSKLYDEARRIEPQFNAQWLSRTWNDVGYSQAGAQFARGKIRAELAKIANQTGSRELLKNRVPRLTALSKELNTHLTSAADLGQRKRMGDLVLKQYSNYVIGDPVLSKIPGLIEDGKVNWSLLRGDAPWRRGTPRRVEASAGQSLPQPLKKVMTPDLNLMSVNLPVSPIDLQVARTLYTRILRGQAPYKGTKKLGRMFEEAWSQHLRVKTQNSLGRYYEVSRRFFLVDKVLRPSTAAVAHLDEFYRIVKDYGMEGLGMWTQRVAARTTSNVDRGLQRISSGHVNLGPAGRKAEERLQRFRESVPREINGRQQSMFAATGEVWRNIEPGSWEHEFAGMKVADFFLEDPGFAAFRRGEFAEWWGREDNWMKTMTVSDEQAKVSRLMTMAEAEKMYNTMWEWLISGAKNKSATTAAWTRALETSTSMGRPAGVPQWVLNELPTLPAWGRNQEAFNAFQPFNEAMDTLFLQPQGGRQELISTLERTYQTKRLESLFQSQGYRIVEMDEMEKLATQLGFPVPLSRAHSGFLDERLTAAKIIPRSYVDSLVDRAATQAIDDIMYKWHVASPMGQAARHVAPFGKPWGDMWSHYMRGVFAKPVLRGHVVKENAGPLSSWIEQGMRHYPVGILPNRTTAMVSRIAALDMELENQDINIRVPWPLSIAFGDDVNIEGVDLGPMTFLPHKGENPFFSLIPGMGVLPTVFLDVFVPDPLSNPDEWNGLQRWMNEDLPAFMPQTEYGSSSPLGRYLGGGWVASILRMMAGTGLRSGGEFPAPWSLMEFIGDTQGSAQAVRSIKSVMGQSESWDEVLSYAGAGMSEQDLIATMMDSFVYTSLEDAGEGLFQRTLLRQVVPSRFNTDPTIEDIEEIWLEAGTRFPQLLSDRDRQELASNPQNKDAQARAAAEIRSAFYDLSVDERDKLILQYPGLAAQLVSGWTWNQLKVDEIPGLEGSAPFQHFPGEAGAEKFEQYKKFGWLIPRPAKDVFLSTLGYYFVVQDRAARNIYTEAVQWIMDNDPEAAFLNEGEALNDQWRSNNVVRGQGGFPSYILDYVFSAPAGAMSEEARLLGIDLGDTFSGEELVNAIHERLASNRENPLHALTAGRYLNEADFRGAAQDQALAQIALVSAGDDEYPDQFVDFVRALKDEMRVGTPLYNNVREEPHIAEEIATLRDAYAWMAHSYPGFAWRSTWEEAFADDFGVWPDDWNPPEPPTGHPRDRGGFQPYVWNVVDGDTIEVSQNNAQGVTFSPMFANEPSVTVGDMQRTPQAYSVRLLGIRTPEYSLQPEEAEAEHRTLFEALQNAAPGSIWLVPDERFPEVDQFGRRLAWLWIDGSYHFNPDSFLPTDAIAFDLAPR